MAPDRPLSTVPVSICQRTEGHCVADSFVFHHSCPRFGLELTVGPGGWERKGGEEGDGGRGAFVRVSASEKDPPYFFFPPLPEDRNGFPPKL